MKKAIKTPAKKVVKKAVKKAPIKIKRKPIEKSNLSQIIGMDKEIIKKRNDAFNKLSEHEKRKHVLNEALLIMRENKFIAGDGYGRTYPKSSYCYLPSGDIQKQLMNGLVCEGCAKTAIVVARASLGDRAKMGSSVSALAHRVSFEIFGKRCADLIEALYEEVGSGFDYGSEENIAFENLSSSLPGRWGSPSNRLKAIFKRMLKDDGYLVIAGEKY